VRFQPAGAGCKYTGLVQVYLQQHSNSQDGQNDPRQQWWMSAGTRRTYATQRVLVQACCSTVQAYWTPVQAYVVLVQVYR
jgi:hypothetical protein